MIGNSYDLPRIDDWVVVGFLEGFNKPVCFGKLQIQNDDILNSTGYNAIHGDKKQYDETFKNLLGFFEWHYAQDGSLTLRINRTVADNANLNIIVEGASENEGNLNLQLTGSFSIQQKDKAGIDGVVVQTLTFDKNQGLFQLDDKNKNLWKIGNMGLLFETPLDVVIAQKEGDTVKQQFKMDMQKGGIKAMGKTDGKDEMILYGETTKQLLSDLIDAILALVFMTDTGATLGILPDSILKLNQLKASLPDILVD